MSRRSWYCVMRSLHNVLPNEVVQRMMTATQTDVDSS